MGGRVGEWADGFEQLDDRARPAVRHDQRQRVRMGRLHMDEVDVQPVELGLELRQRVQSRFTLAPVVLGRPEPGERLRRRQLHTLRAIGDEFLGRPTSRIDATAKVVDRLLLELNRERLHGRVADDCDGVDRSSVLVHPSLLPRTRSASTRRRICPLLTGALPFSPSPESRVNPSSSRPSRGANPPTAPPS